MSQLQSLRYELVRAGPFSYLSKARMLLACRHRSAGRLRNSASTQTQIQGSELSQPNIYLVYELLVHMKGPVLQNSMTQGHNRLSERSPSKDTVLIV